MVRPEDVHTDACPGCGVPGEYQQPMADGELGRFVCSGLRCRVEAFVGREPEEDDRG